MTASWKGEACLFKQSHKTVDLMSHGNTSFHTMMCLAQGLDNYC